MLVFFFLFSFKTNQQAQIVNNNIITPSPSPSDYPNPTIKTSKTQDNKTLIEVEEHKIKVKIPEDWSYSLFKDTVQYVPMNGVDKPYRGVLWLHNPDKTVSISLIPNFKGGYCEGAPDIKEETVPKRFGLVGHKTVCKDTYYLYGDRIPNLFIPITGNENKTVKEILSSIEYIP